MEVEIPEAVQIALANMLHVQFELGVVAGKRGRKNVSPADCAQTAYVLKALVNEIKAAMANDTRAALDVTDAELARLRARMLELEAVHEDASGAVLTERDRYAQQIRRLHWMPRVPGRWDETDVAHAEGFNKARAEALAAIGA